MHDMDKMQNEEKTQPRRESHIASPEKARVGVQIWKVVSGALQITH